MITQLTKDQKKRFPEFVAKWTKIGLCTDPADRPRAEASVKLAYQIAGLAPPEKIVWCGSPLSQGLTRAIVFGLKEDSVGDSVGDSVLASVRDSVWASVRASVGASVWDSVRASVWDSVGASVGASVRASVWDSVGASVGDSCYGQHDSHWLSFYDFFDLVCSLSDQTKQLAGLREISQSANWWLPHKKFCWISERHDLVRLRRNLLHCDGGPAIHYPDGWSIWALNGVRVPQWLAEDKAESLDPKRVLKLENAQQRAEGVRKVGAERLLHSISPSPIDTHGDYELHTIDIGEGRTGNYLKMLNPSVPELWHVEGVPDECDTVQKSLNWRNGLTEEQIDEENGADYYQQGDVILRPKGVRKFKSKPIVLT